VPQRERLDVILPLTALDVVLMGRSARLAPLARLGPADYEAARRALAQLDAEALARRPYRSLSGGQQQPLVLSLATSIMLFARDTLVQGPLDDVLDEERLTALYGVPVHLGVVAGSRTLVVGAQKAG
jgi:ABC-type cobalamin/Fe3+-siderophores transport system ATPase subunit